jgi:hypothetical protein
LAYHPPSTCTRKTAWFLAIVFTAAVLGSGQIKGAVLNWNSTANWTAGTPNTTGVSQAFAGSDATGITVKIQDSSAATVWQNGSNGVSTVPSPGINNTLLTDHLTNQKALQLSIFSEPSTSATVTVTVTFAKAVTNVNFTLWDVDKATAGQQGNGTGNSYTDLISNIGAKLVNGTTVSATTITDGASDGVDNNKTNATTVTGTQVTGGSNNGGTENDALNSGQVSISFGTQAITSFTFQWSNPGWVSGDGSQQFISLGNINYTLASPEVGPGLAAVAVCGCLAGGSLLHRQRARGLISPALD